MVNEETPISHPAEQVVRHHHGVQAWFIWSFGGLFYLYQFILRNSPGVMTDDLMRDFSVEACALGVLTSFYLISYSSLQIPVGIGMDKFGPTRLLRGAILLCVVGTALFAVSESFQLACLSRLLIGVGSTCAFLGSLKLATCWFPPEKLALVVGFTMLAGKIGATFGQAPLALLIDIFGWRDALLYVVVPIGLALAAGVWFFVSDEPPEGPLVPRNVTETSLNSLLTHLKEIIVDYRIWALGFYGALMYVPMLAFVDLWGIPFLMKLYDIDRATAGSVTTMFYVGVGIGSPVVAILSDYFKARKVPMAIGAILSILFNGLIIYMPNVPFSAMYGLLFAAGVVFSAQPLIFASVCQLTPVTSNGTVISFTNMIVMMLGLVTQPLVGWFLDKVWEGVMYNGVPHYTVADYRFALLSIPLSLLLALLLMPLIPETFPRSKEELD
ncbi:MAG: MFS transporter [Alphaproteobacteria bacterium]|nr:MFS transporter [Alphaproteobacteria bacterium]